MNRILQFLSSISLFIKRVTGFSHILFTAFFVLSILPLWGQGGNFPVQVIPQALPPAPIYISNYADASTVSSPLRVQIILNDFEIANREIRLKTYVVGSGLNFESNDLVVGASPLFLEGGVPLVLNNVDLAPYFQYENISGISPNVYGQPIPEGAYQFCFEVYDVLTGNRLSNRSCAVSVVFQNEPPFLVSPRNNTNVDEVNPQYIVFQWTPRSINVSNVEYELSLVEIWDNQVDPQQAFLSSPPIFQATTTSPTYVYGPSDPLLLSGKNYAWRVQANARQGTEEIGLFKNEGYSEIFSFSYASACELPLGINHEVKGSTNANIFWDDFSTEIPEYTVRYRQKNVSDAEWFMNNTTANQTTIWDLKAGTTYQYQILKQCAVTGSEWSITKEFTTFIADNEESVYDCNITPEFDLSNSQPLQNISAGEQFTAGDFPINVLTASGSNGYFTGTGYVTIPYLNSIRVGVEFTNIFINTDKKLAEGTVTTLYDPTMSNILDIDEAIDTVENIVDSVGEFFEGDTDRDEITVNWAITKDDIKVEDGNVIITNPNTGATKTEPLGDDMAITDSAGNTFYVTEDGEITEGGQVDDYGSVNGSSVTGVSNSGQIEALTAPGIKVTFNTKGSYGMDMIPTGSALGNIPQEYTVIKDATGADYPLTHHAVKLQGNTTIVGAISIQNSDYEAEDLIFKNKIGEIIPRTIEGDSVSISLPGRHTFENETIYALVESKVDSTKQLTAGAFTLWHLTERSVDVAIVSVGASMGDVETTVQNIFKQGVANINFKPRISLNVDEVASALGTNGMDIGDSPFTAAYNTEQKALKNLAKAAGANDPNTYYILVLGDEFLNTKQIAGFMPLQRQYGFVFERYTGGGEEAKGSIAKTLAHEIGHGVFALQHPFTEYGSSENATDWLMDYSNGDNLPHTHWAQIHNPNLKFYIFQDEEDGELPTDPMVKIMNTILNSGNKGLVKCKKCDHQSNSNIDGVINTTINGIGYSCLFGEVTGETGNSNLNFFTDYSEESTITASGSFDLYNYIKNNINLDDDILFLVKNNTEITKCTILHPLPNSFCDNPNITNHIVEEISEEIANCIESNLLSDTEIIEILQGLNSYKRSNQLNQFTQEGNVYQLNTNGTLENISNPLSDAQITNGEWSDETYDQTFRIYKNANGVLQLKAVGIRNNIAKFDNKSADLLFLSENMKVKGNAFLLENTVTEITQTPQQKGLTLDVDDFPDGEKINIDEAVSFFKIIYEGGGLLGTLLKTGNIEEATYLESTKGEVTIHGPPILTGATEAGVRAVTDITGTVVLVYDLAVSQETRNQTWNGLKTIKDEIAQDPSKIWPLLGEALLEEGSGNSLADWEAATNENTDLGKRKHTYSKGTVRTTASVFLGGQFIAKLPEIAKNIITKMGKAKGRLNLKSVAEGSQLLQEKLDGLLEQIKNLPDNGTKFLEDFADATDETIEKFLTNPNLVDAWAAVSKHPNISKHTPSLEKISDLLKDGDFMGKLPNGRTDLDAIIDAVKNPLDGGTASKLVKLSDHLENLKQVVKKHSGADGFDRLMVDLKNPAFAMQDGATHMLNDVKNIASGKVKKFDYEFDGDGVVCTKCRFDVELEASPGDLKLIEYKSWSLENITNLSGRQMTEYFRGIDNISEMKYVFNELKTPDVGAVKTQMKSVLSGKVDDIFDAMSPNLKNSLGIDDIDDLSDLINYTSSNLYNFIDIK